MSEKISDRHMPLADSGVGSIGSESDTSPGAPTTIIDSPEHTTPEIKMKTDQKHEDSLKYTFQADYYGHIEIDKRYVQAQFWKVFLQWLVAEMKRRGSITSVNLTVSANTLMATCKDNGKAVFENDLHGISKFSRTQLDATCFAYVTKCSDKDFLCHFFKTDSESVVQDIFRAIRTSLNNEDRDKLSHGSKAPSDVRSQDQNNTCLSLYEVLYVGKVVVSSNKIQPNFIDDAVDKFKIYEAQKELEITERHRRSSGQSVQSLPGNVEKQVTIKENQLQSIVRDNAHSQSDDSVTSVGSSDDFMLNSSSDTMHLDVSQTGASVLTKQNLLAFEKMNSDNSVECIPADKNARDGSILEHGPNKLHKLHRTVVEQQTHGKKNRTMLLQISRNDVSLISPDRKRTILKRFFTDISFCSQGIRHPEHFGFITRDSDAFVCFVFMCTAESVVEDVMQTLKLAFEAAFQQSAKTHTCELCPMHQLQKVAEEIDKLPWQEMLDIITRRVEQLSEADQEEFHQNVKEETPESVQEHVECAVISLRHMCEARQHKHVHISDANQNLVTKYQFTLSEGSRSRYSAFDDLRIRAKKSLTESFETIKERVRHRSGDKLGRGASQESEPGDNEVQTSGITSPTSLLRGLFFPTSPTNVPDHLVPELKSPTSGEPETRPRCGTNPTSLLQKLRDLHGSIPESSQENEEVSSITSPASAGTSKTDEGHEDKDSSAKRAFADGATEKSVVDESLVKPEAHRYDSPLRTMFIKAGNKDKRTPPSSPGRSRPSPGSRPPLHRAGSWRLDILNRVVTPAKISVRSQSARSASVTSEEDPFPPVPTENTETTNMSTEESSLDNRLSSHRYRVLWRKAILETLLVIRTKKQMNMLQTRQETAGTPPVSPQKLEYEEITPCLKQVTKIWSEMLSTPQRACHKFDFRRIEQAVKDGVPRSKRGDIWRLLTEQHRFHSSAPVKNSGHSELDVRYEDLLKQLTIQQHAILIDLGRTFPTHPYFSTQLGAGQLSLFNVLKAYSLLDKEVGYCQGLSFVAGVLLIHMPEEVAFDIMRYMMFSLGFRRQYRPDMVALQIQMYQLSRLLHDQHRDLYDHFELHEIAPTLYAAPWFLTMFASQFPLGFVARVFDVILLQGSMDVVLKVALVVLGNHKELIKNCTSFESIVSFLKTDLPAMGIIQMERVVNQVFALDIAKQLHAYEVEYHVLQEEMVSTPQRSESDVVSKLESANHGLKKQNLELLEQLQTAHSHIRNLETQVNKLVSGRSSLQQHIRTLELERSALLSTMARVRSAVPEAVLQAAGITLPATAATAIPFNMISSLFESVGGGDPVFASALDNEVAMLMDEKTLASKPAVQKNSNTSSGRSDRNRRPSSLEN